MKATARQRQATRWLVLALYLNALFWTIPYVRPLSRAVLRAGYSRWLLGAIGVAFAAVILVGALRRARPRAIASGLAVYALLVAYLRAIPDEVVHLAEYGLLGLLVQRAIAPSGRAAASCRAIFLTAAIGFVDEWTQGATPGRYFDWRDVVVNFVAAGVPVLLLARAEREKP